MFILVGMVTLGRPGRGCYRLVSEHGSPLISDGAVCVGLACMSVACVSLTLVFHLLVALHHVDHGCSKVIMRNLM